MASTTIYPGHSDKAHPEIFSLQGMPRSVDKKKPGQLPDNIIRQFYEDGFVIVEDFFKREELDAVREDINGLVEELAQKLYKAGKVKRLYNEYGLFERLTKLEDEFPGTNIILHKTGKLPPSFRKLWANERLLNVVEQIIGPEIAASPVWNLRTKTPKNEPTVVPWHQDSAYFDNDSYNVMIPTAWIPLLDTDEYNGGMQMVKGGQRLGRICEHQCCYGNTWYVMCEEEEMEKTLGVDMKNDVVTCKVPYGSFILFNNITPHRSLPNISKDIRWALDLRWQRPDQPYGLYGLKNGVVLRSAKEPNLKIDWESYVAVDRTSVQKKSVEDLGIDKGQEEEFDRTIQGPWMKKWELTHLNEHTRKHEIMEKSKQ